MVVELYRLPPGNVGPLCASPETLEELYPDMFPEVGVSGHFSLDKLWQAVHFTLTGEAMPVAYRGPLNIVYGGAPLAEFEVGMGPPLGFTAEQVAASASALAEADFATMIAGVSSAQLAENDVYPFFEPGDDRVLHEELAAYLQGLEAFYAAAAAGGEAVIAIYA